MYRALPPELHVKDSPVAGQGLFAKEDIDAMMYLGISHVVVDEDIMRTPLGGFVNHSEDPNCVKWYEEEDWGKEAQIDVVFNGIVTVGVKGSLALGSGLSLIHI